MQSGENIYVAGSAPNNHEVNHRIETYWRPYHDKLGDELDRIRNEFGNAVLWEAHSIQSKVPTLFDGVLPQMNFGTNNGASCHPALQDAVYEEAKASGYSVVLNERFKGGYITRYYGNPKNGIHAVQLELAQRSYMDEESWQYDETGANQLAKVVRSMLRTIAAEAQRKLGLKNSRSSTVRSLS